MGCVVGVVLVVEDEPLNATLAETVLRRAGHQVLMAADGPTALDIARRRVPDLILLDVSLTGSMNGLDVCRRLRSDPTTAGIAVLVLSGWTFESDVTAAHDAGADGYLAKPFAAADLVARVQQLIDGVAARTADGGAR